jgi:hypothetical protein
MLRYLFIAFALLIIASDVYGQSATPTYTTFLGLRKYATGANASGDSLNANSDDIDAWAKATQDTVDDLKADVRNIIAYDGGIINGSVTFDDLSTSAKASLVQTAGTQSIAGIKSYTDNMNTESIFPTTDVMYNLGSITKQWYRGYFNSLRTHTLVVINPSDANDTSQISYDGEKIDFGTAKVKIDTLDVSNQTVSLRQEDFTIPDLGDTVITLAKLSSSLYMQLAGDGTAGIEKILCDVTVPAEFLLYITTDNNTYSIMFEDGETDGNLMLTGDFTLGKGDILVLKASYRMNALETLYWQEVSRSNNN